MKKLMVTLFLVSLSFSVFSGIKSKEPYLIKVSQGEFSILEIEGKKIKSVDVEQSLCEIEFDRSKELGKLVFKPTSSKPFTLFVTDKEGVTYPIRVTPDPALKTGLYIIRKREKKKLPSVEELLNIRKTTYSISLQEPRTKVITAFLKSMIEGDTPSNVKVKKDYEQLYLWEEVNFTKLQTNTLGNLEAVKYSIKNISKEEMVLLEKEFFQVQPNVFAIALEKLKLKEGETTYLYIVSEKGK